MKKVVLNFGKGSLRRGCDSIVVHYLDERQKYGQQLIGSLPPAAELSDLHHQWQALYQAAYQDRAMRISFMRSSGSVRYSESEFILISQQLQLKLNEWLNSAGFGNIERSLRTELTTSEAVQIILVAEDERLQQLPWHLWNFFNDYPSASISFSSLKWRESNLVSTAAKKVRILAVLGCSEGINLKADIETLENLPDKELVLLYEPRLKELNEYLWDEAGWDILFFSGHSETKLQSGRLFLNADESLTIDLLKNSLGHAIARGLKIAIFNSCEGVGLAADLAQLNLPYTVVMREPVPDAVAQIFLKDFLSIFARGKTFTLAVREAREKLQGWEQEYYCASWLPSIWQNPTAPALTWQDLQAKQPIKIQEHPAFASLTKAKACFKQIFLASAIASSLTIGIRALGILEPLELAAYDALMRQRPAETIDPRLLTVEITEADTNRDRYPLSDRALVEAIDSLEQHQPLAIGLDIHRAYPRDEAYDALIEKIDSNPNLFSVCSYGAKDSSYNPPQGMTPEQLEYQMGFSDLPLDSNNSMVRRQILSYDPNLTLEPSKCLTPYSLSFRLAYQYLHQKSVSPLEVNSQEQWQFGKVKFERLTSGGGYQNLDGSNQILLNYRNGQPSKKITLQQLISGSFESDSIEDKIVIIGYTAPVARDSSATPYGRMPNLEIQAHMTSQILSSVLDGRSLIWTLPQQHGIQWGDWLWIFGSTAISSAIVVILGRKYYLYGILSAIILILFWHQIYLLFFIKGGWLPSVPSAISLLVAVTIVAVHDARQRKLITPLSTN